MPYAIEMPVRDAFKAAASEAEGNIDALYALAMRATRIAVGDDAELPERMRQIAEKAAALRAEFDTLLKEV